MPSWQVRRKTHEVPCELCKQAGQRCQKLNPHNWQPETRRLCRKHRLQLGFHPVDYSRGAYTSGRIPGQ